MVLRGQVKHFLDGRLFCVAHTAYSLHDILGQQLVGLFNGGIQVGVESGFQIREEVYAGSGPSATTVQAGAALPSSVWMTG